MHDAAPHYETFVIDDPDASPTPIAIGRVSTEDLVAHVLVMGQRHRRTPDLGETSCGVAIHSQFYPPLREQLTHADTPGGLCSQCFTPHEIMRALQADKRAAEAAEEDRRRRDEAAKQRLTKRWKRPTEGDR